MSKDSLFQDDEEAIRSALEILASHSSEDIPWPSHYEQLLAKYKKLLSSTRRLIKVSDLMQNDMAVLNEKLGAANRLQGQFLATAATSIIVTDLEGTINQVSESFCSTTGFSREEVIGTNCKELCGHPGEENWMFQCTPDAPVFRREFALKTKEGAILSTLMNAARLTDGVGRPVGAILSFVDVTELIEARQAAEAADNAKSRFLASMSHEIRTPLTGILGFTEILLDEEVADEQRDALEAIKRSGDSLLILINDILDLSKIEANRFELESVAFYLEDVIIGACEITRAGVEKKNVEILCDLHDAPAQLIGDPTRLQQVLTNLLSNAVKFTNDGEIVTTVRTVDQTDDRVNIRISVRDTGIGIPENRIDRIFESFVQANGSTARKYGGTGLGLAITAKMVRLMGGDIVVRSRLGEGSTFEMDLWLGKAPAALNAVTLASDSELWGKPVLFIDDNATSLSILADMAKPLGIQYVCADNIQEALNALEVRAFDAVFIDTQMPRWDEADFARALGRHRTVRPPRLIGLTAHVSHAPGRPVAAMAFDGHLVKPVRKSALISQILKSGGVPGDRIRQSNHYLVRELSLPNLRILLAEDEPVSRMVAERLLRKMGHEIDLADDGEAALEMVRSREYDVIFMDMQMPKMDGLAATRSIRSLGLSLPIVAMTASAMKGDRERCTEAGMDDYISKPFKRETIMDVLRRHFGFEAKAGA